VPRGISHKEQRKWARLQLAIPVFLRARDGNGKDFLEFATATNISPGGALVVIRRSLPKSAVVSLEIPSAPVGPARTLKNSARIMRAKTIWVTHLDDHHLLGLKFTHPLHTDTRTAPRRTVRKSGSAV
jgi:PilZ domain